MANNTANVKPTVSLMGTQLASTSIITVLTGGFFFAQSASRLLKEYRNGSLKEKWGRLVVGSSTHSGNNKVAGANESSVKDVSYQKGTAVSMAESNVVAAYQQES